MAFIVAQLKVRAGRCSGGSLCCGIRDASRVCPTLKEVGCGISVDRCDDETVPLRHGKGEREIR